MSGSESTLDSYPLGNVIDGDLGTRWATQVGPSLCGTEMKVKLKAYVDEIFSMTDTLTHYPCVILV